MQVLPCPRLIMKAWLRHRRQRTSLSTTTLLSNCNLFNCLIFLVLLFVILLQILPAHSSLLPSENRFSTQCMTSHTPGFRPRRSWLLHVLSGQTCRETSKLGLALVFPAKGIKFIVTLKPRLVNFYLPVNVFSMFILASSAQFRPPMVVLIFLLVSIVSLAGPKPFLSLVSLRKLSPKLS